MKTDFATFSQLNNSFVPRPEWKDPWRGGAPSERDLAKLLTGRQPLSEIEFAGLVTLQRAQEFLAALPADMPTPDCCVSEDGDVDMDWQPGPIQAFSVTVGDTGKAAYAWLTDEEKGHDVADFHEGWIEPKMLAKLAEVLKYKPDRHEGEVVGDLIQFMLERKKR